MSGSRCPVCGKQWSIGSRLFASDDQCACEQRNTPTDFILEVGCSADWMGEGYLLLKDILKNIGKVEYINNDSNTQFKPVEIKYVQRSQTIIGRILKGLFG
jgi:hypothetical protein